MNKLIVFIWLMVSLLSGIMTSPLFSQSWERQAEGLATRWQKIDAVDSNVAVAIAWTKVSDGRQGIFRTLDGGRSWHEIPWIEQRIGGMVDISITDSLNFWVLTPFSIDHTSDGGRTWEQQHAGDSTTSWFNYIEMFDSVNGIAMGDALPGQPALILRTEDGGQNWISQNQSYFLGAHSTLWHGVQFVSPQIGYCRFSYFGVHLSALFLHKTIDGGITWSQLPLSQIDFELIRFYDEKIGLACWLGNSPIYRTIDGGITWNEYPLNLNKEWVADIEFFPGDPSKALAAFHHHLYMSSDTGRTWVEMSAPDIMYNDIKMVDTHHGWIAGEEGVIHTSSGWVTSVSTNKYLPEEFVLQQNFPNPFNLATEISFTLKYPEVVELRIYNLYGEEVATLLKNQLCQAGHHCVKFNADGLASGIYLYRFSSSRGFETRRMILLK